MKDPLLTNPYFWIPIIMGVVYFVIGYVMIKYPPKDRNGFYGYRTKRARQSDQHWAFAQKFSGIMLKKFGMLCLPLCTIGFISEGKSDLALTLIIVAIALFPAVMVIYLTEKYLKEL